MNSGNPLQIDLLSFPGSTLTLPAGSQVLTPRSRRREPLDRSELLQTIQARVLGHLAALENSKTTSCRLLLLLPDKTRRQTAAHLAIDALLELCEQDQRFSLTLLFGLGTHPLMSPSDIEQMVGCERLQRLRQQGVSLHQQTTLAPLPLCSLTVANPLRNQNTKEIKTNGIGIKPDAEQMNGDGDGEHQTNNAQETLQIQVPDMLWTCDLLLTAGDTDLHPYEGRAGSGGIHKMLAIGVGCLNTIRATHSLDILTHPLTRPGEKNNRFVKLVDHFAREIITALKPPKGRLLAAPIGISVVAQRLDQPEAFWIGDQEEERAVLMQPLEQERTLLMQEAVDVVVADTEYAKGTDLLAGARSLHFVCNFDELENPILQWSSPIRTALLFNACHEARNAHGIGNSGTVLHLQALHQFSLDAYKEASTEPRDDLTGNTIRHQGQQPQQQPEPGKQQQPRQQALKIKILDRWEQYLHLVSEEDKLFASLEERLQTPSWNGEAETRAMQILDRALPHSFGAHRHVIAGTRQRLLISDHHSALAFLQQATDQLGFKGLGEGGQRALRLLTILRTFDHVLVATDNPVVLEFLEGFNSPGGPKAPINETQLTAPLTMPHGLIGLTGLSLKEHTPQGALDLALHWHDRMLTELLEPESTAQASNRRLAFLQEPVILKSRHPIETTASKRSISANSELI